MVQEEGDNLEQIPPMTWTKLNGLLPVSEDWHEKMCFLGVSISMNIVVLMIMISMLIGDNHYISTTNKVIICSVNVVPTSWDIHKIDFLG